MARHLKKNRKESPRKTAERTPGRRMAERADPHILYEEAVQCVEAEIDFVDQEFEHLRGRPASRLREDFCGTSATSCEWVRRRDDNHAVGVDLDSNVLAWGRAHHVDRLEEQQRERIDLVNADVLQVETKPQDMVLAMNFSYWMFKTRAALRGYFERVRGALVYDGVFFLDCFGGFEAFRVREESTKNEGFTYVWDQADYNPVNGDILCHIHFRFRDGSQLRNAFTYDWRLWTIPEIRELLCEAGFQRTTVYWQTEDEDEETGEFEPVERADADAGWICYISAEKRG